MQIRNATGPKAEEETRVFTAFIRTRSWEARSDVWEYRSNKPIDFVSLERANSVGVELCEWMGREQAEWVAERNRFRAQIESEIAKRGLYQFEYFGPRSRCTVHAWVIKLPGRAEKAKVIDELIDFIVEFERTKRSEIYRGMGIAEAIGPALPANLAPFFAQIFFYGGPTGDGLGVPLTKARAFGDTPLAETESAARSLRQALTGKIVAKAEIYEAAKRRLGLSELWLVVHYSSPDVFNARELGMQVGYGAHRRETQDRTATKASTLLGEIGKGPFDRVFFMVDCQPETYVSELGPIAANQERE